MNKKEAIKIVLIELAAWITPELLEDPEYTQLKQAMDVLAKELRK